MMQFSNPPLKNYFLLISKFLTIFFISNISQFPQVVIEERVEINPGIINNNLSESFTEHSFTYFMSWTPSSERRARIETYQWCGGDSVNSSWSLSGTVSLTFPANGRHYYQFRAQRYFYHNFWGWGWWDSSLPEQFLQVLIDDIDLNHNQSQTGGQNGINGIFALQVNDLDCQDGTIELSPSAFAMCDSTNWYFNDPVGLQITQGEIDFNFYNTATGTNLGSSTQSDYEDLPNIILKRNINAPPFFTPRIVKLQANINGVIGNTSEIYYPDNFVIRAPSYPDTLNAGNSGEIYIDVYHYCLIVPAEMKINIDITGGSEFGNLIDPVTGEHVQSVHNLDHYYGNANLTYIADGVTPDSTDSVKIRISMTDPEVPSKDITIFINPSPLSVTIEPLVLSAKDTANIIIKKRNPDGSLEDFPSGQTFEVAELDGCINGSILFDDSLGVYFADAQLPIYFVAADSVEENRTSVRLRIGIDTSSFKFTGYNNRTIKNENDKLFNNEEIIIGGIKFSTAELREGFEKLIDQKKQDLTLNKNKNDKSLLVEPKLNTSCYFGNFLYKVIYWMGDLETQGEHTILLGEMKFFGVKKKTENGTVTEIKIEEIEVEQDATPIFPNLTGNWSWIQNDSVWSDRPINIETHGQSPVFYDKFYAKVFYNGTTKPTVHDLPDGMIRIIGRYLGKTPDNKGKLFTAQYQNSFTDTLEIQVIKPSKLGETDRIINGPTKVAGVFEDYDIDSLIIDIAGEMGILPQIIKGIMKKESIDFQPSYRYEIYQDIGGTIRNKFDSAHTYWIKSTTEPGFPDIPDHGTIWYSPSVEKPGYPEPTKAWNFLMDEYPKNFKLYYNRDTTIFVIKPSDNVTSAIYDSQKKKIMEFYNAFYDSLKKNGLTSLQAQDSAKVKTRREYIYYLKEEFGGVGMDSLYAQTRIIASYGLMQLTYYSGATRYVGWGYNYPNNDINYLPEDINIIPINIEYGTKHFLGKLRDALGPIKYLNEDTWNKNYGFELSYWEGLFRYNGGKSEYPNPVFDFAKSYLPKK